MIKYIKGDLLTTNCEIIAHGCNCSGGFGSGIAGLIAKKYPIVKENYLKKYWSVSGWALGDIQFNRVNTSFNEYKIIINCATQFYYGREAKYGKVYVSYEAIEIIMNKLYNYSKENNLKIAIPKIGAGLAGGDWKVIEKIINDIFIDIDIFCYYID